MAEPSHSWLFEKAITVIPIDTKTYGAHLEPAWCIGKGMSYTLADDTHENRGEAT